MPHNALKLIPGVDTTKTPTLNEAAISDSQFIRFVPDRTLGGIVQKLGGWTKFFNNTLGSIVRNLWAWEDTNNNSYLAVGAEGKPAGAGGALQIITGGGATDITPQTTTVNIAVSFSTVAGSNKVTITHASSNISDYDNVNIQTQIAVGGLVLFGTYQCYAIGSNTYKIKAKDVFGDPVYATSTVTNGGTVAQFTTVSGSGFVAVTLANHGYSEGSTFPVLVATSFNGVTLYGNYTIISVASVNQFVILASTVASASGSTYENSGQVRLLYYKGIGPLPAGTGYGVGGYGRGGYGTGIPPSSGSGSAINAADWTLDNWGEILVSNPINGAIYTWNPANNQTLATIITNSPTVNEGMFVAMPQRQIVAWGSTFTGIKDPMLIRWCDINNYDVWVGQITNQAGSYRIPKGSKIVQCIQGPQQGLIWTDLAIWAMQYVSAPEVYQFNEIGTNCGLIGHRAAGTMNGAVYWMGQSQFYRISGGGVEPIRCPIWDVVFQELDRTNADKIRIATNSRFGEVSWYFPTTSSNGEISKYVKYNVLLDQWDYGTLSRTAWINESVLGPPIGAAPNQYLYQHETSPDADGQPMVSYFQTGYFVLSEADLKMFVDQVWPDAKWGYYNGSQDANLNLTFYVADYPTDTPKAYGPFLLTDNVSYVTPRFRGRLVAIRVESEDIGSWWRLGNMRYRFQEDGKF